MEPKTEAKRSQILGDVVPAPGLLQGSRECDEALRKWREQNAQRGAVEGQDGGKVGDKST